MRDRRQNSPGPTKPPEKKKKVKKKKKGGRINERGIATRLRRVSFVLPSEVVSNKAGPFTTRLVS